MKCTQTFSRWGQAKRRGFTMVESLLLVAILGMTAAGVGQGMVQMSNRAVDNNNTLWLNDQLLSQMELLRATYASKVVPYSNSQTITNDGHSYTMTSNISQANPGSGNQNTFLELKVQVALTGGVYDTMCTYVSE